MSQDLIHECVGNGGVRVCSIRLYGETLEEGLQENGRYEYELDTPGLSLREVPGQKIRVHPVIRGSLPKTQATTLDQ